MATAKKASIAKPVRDTKKTLAFAEGKATAKPKVAKTASKGVSGQIPEDDVRLTSNIRQDLHLRLKIEAAKRRVTIGEIVEEMIEKHIPEL